MAVASIRFGADDAIDAVEAARQLRDALRQPLNGQLVDLESRLRDFEIRYEMPSEEMRRQYRAGKLRETHDICRWLMLLDVRDHATTTKR